MVHCELPPRTYLRQAQVSISLSRWKLTSKSLAVTHPHISLRSGQPAIVMAVEEVLALRARSRAAPSDSARGGVRQVEDIELGAYGAS